ncbi:YceI family protein [Aquimarina sp. AU474]|uniref:YceI family protein n=1 Tax=Aquimarina sp. AU474 TaxID=2108529 RepID=UPI00135C7B93|nr:YceI family protein [Aquimarina sp. AU474]
MKVKFFILTVLCIAVTNLSFNPTTDNYTLDVGHTYIGFDVERFLVGEVSGRFNTFIGDVSLSGNAPESITVNIKINTNSLDTNNQTRDGHLKGEMWLDTAAYPEITFVSNTVKKVKQGYVMQGDLTIKNITKTIEFPVDILGPFNDPTKKIAIGIKADLVIDRFDYGIAFNKKMDNGSFFIGNEVKIKIRALAYKN